MARVNTDDRIVMAMAELMRKQGYGATGMKQISEAANAPIGSIYHHFTNGKRDVAAEALRRSGAAYGELVITLLSAYDDVAQALTAAFDTAAGTIVETDWMNMCPVSTVAGEIADTEPHLRAVAAEVMTGWVEAGTTLLVSRGLGEDDARSLVEASIAALEGAFVLARTRRSAEPLHAAGRAMAAYVRTMQVDRTRASTDQRPVR